jgi:hypothetical protein
VPWKAAAGARPTGHGARNDLAGRVPRPQRGPREGVIRQGPRILRTPVSRRPGPPAERHGASVGPCVALPSPGFQRGLRPSERVVRSRPGSWPNARRRPSDAGGWEAVTPGSPPLVAAQLPAGPASLSGLRRGERERTGVPRGRSRGAHQGEPGDDRRGLRRPHPKVPREEERNKAQVDERNGRADGK